jgi:hypothetical protein
MASKFTITAELNLQTKNLNQVVNNLRQQFQGANLNINIKDLAQAQSQINKISSSAQNAQKSVGLLGSSFSQAFKNFTIDFFKYLGYTVSDIFFDNGESVKLILKSDGITKHLI